MAETPQRTDYGHSMHEERDVNIRLITLSGLGLLVLLGGSLILVAWLWRAFEPEPPEVSAWSSPSTEAQPLPPQPRLQASPAQDWRDMRASEDGQLHAYGWVDQDAGVVHIPIDHAIELLTTKGMPTWHEEQAPANPQGQEAPPR
jgi:hypothetical protein